MLKEFLDSHELKLGQEYSIKPSAKYAVLRESLKNYYETFQSGWSKSWKLSHFTIINNKHVKLNSAFGHDYVMNCYNSIIHLQMFLELYIVEMLGDIHPALVKGRFNKEIDILSAINWTFDTDFDKKKTLNFEEILRRLEFLIDHVGNLPDTLKLDSKFHFFKDHFETIKIVLELRNIILHKGQGLLKDFALDFFWIKYALPLIVEILDKEDERLVLLDRNTYCGINVIRELNKSTIDSNYSDVENVDQIVQQLNYICHLKELGRASLTNEKFMKEFGNSETEEAMNRSGRDALRLSEIRAMANIMLKQLNYYNKYICPCCGEDTLLSFEAWTSTKTKQNRLHKAKCIQCSYSVNVHIGEPQDFGLMEERIFTII